MNPNHGWDEYPTKYIIDAVNPIVAIKIAIIFVCWFGNALCCFQFCIMAPKQRLLIKNLWKVLDERSKQNNASNTMKMSHVHDWWAGGCQHIQAPWIATISYREILALMFDRLCYTLDKWELLKRYLVHVLQGSYAIYPLVWLRDVDDHTVGVTGWLRFATVHGRASCKDSHSLL